MACGIVCCQRRHPCLLGLLFRPPGEGGRVDRIANLVVNTRSRSAHACPVLNRFPFCLRRCSRKASPVPVSSATTAANLGSWFRRFGAGLSLIGTRMSRMASRPVPRSMLRQRTPSTLLRLIPVRHTSRHATPSRWSVTWARNQASSSAPRCSGIGSVASCKRRDAQVAITAIGQSTPSEQDNSIS